MPMGERLTPSPGLRGEGGGEGLALRLRFEIRSSTLGVRRSPPRAEMQTPNAECRWESASPPRLDSGERAGVRGWRCAYASKSEVRRWAFDVRLLGRKCKRRTLNADGRAPHPLAWTQGRGRG